VAQPGCIHSSAGGEKVNPSSVPNTQLAYNFAAKAAHQLRKWRLEWVTDPVRRLERWLAKGDSMPPLNEEVRRRLSQL